MKDLDKISQLIKGLMAKEDRQEVEFRMNLLAGEIGDLAKYITHDQKLNPNARPYGSKEDEHMAYGQAFIQLVAVAQLRGIDINKAIEIALSNWQDAEWRKTQIRNKNDIKGIAAQPGETEGFVHLDPDCQNLDQLNNNILVTKYIQPQHSPYFNNIIGLITDYGSLNSHPTILAREYCIPCIVGTGNATQKLKHGQKIKIIVNSDQAEIITF